MLWGIAFAVLIAALMIPMVVVVRDARLQRGEAGALAERDPQVEHLTKRVQLLEDELDDLGRVVDQVRDDVQFLQQLLEDPARREEGPQPRRPLR
jgi:hypothetical protein